MPSLWNLRVTEGTPAGAICSVRQSESMRISQAFKKNCGFPATFQFGCMMFSLNDWETLNDCTEGYIVHKYWILNKGKKMFDSSNHFVHNSIDICIVYNLLFLCMPYVSIWKVSNNNGVQFFIQISGLRTQIDLIQRLR